MGCAQTNQCSAVLFCSPSQWRSRESGVIDRTAPAVRLVMWLSGCYRHCRSVEDIVSSRSVKCLMSSTNQTSVRLRLALVNITKDCCSDYLKANVFLPALWWLCLATVLRNQDWSIPNLKPHGCLIPLSTKDFYCHLMLLEKTVSLLYVQDNWTSKQQKSKFVRINEWTHNRGSVIIWFQVKEKKSSGLIS